MTSPNEMVLAFIISGGSNIFRGGVTLGTRPELRGLGLWETFMRLWIMACRSGYRGLQG